MGSKFEIVLDKVDDICEKFELEGLHTHPTYKQLKRLFTELHSLKPKPEPLHPHNDGLDEYRQPVHVGELDPAQRLALARGELK